MFVDLEIDFQSAGEFQLELEAALILDDSGLAGDGFQLLIPDATGGWLNLNANNGCVNDACSGFGAAENGNNLNFVITDCNCSGGPITITVNEGLQTVRIQNTVRGSAVRSLIVTPVGQTICDYGVPLRNMEIVGFVESNTNQTVFDSLEAAQVACNNANTCTGITGNAEGTEFTLRNGRNPTFSSSGEVSFVRTNCHQG